MLILQLSDLHMRRRGEASNRVVESNMLVERALRAAARLRPKYKALIITGDLADRGRAEEYDELARLIAHYVPDAYVIPGNHDNRELLVSKFRPQVAPSGFVDYVIDLGAVRIVMLDSVVPGAPFGELRASQLNWLDSELAKAPKVPTMVAIHHPPFATGIAHMDAIALKSPDVFVDIVARHPQVERIVCGHCHRQIVASVAQAVVTVAPSVGVAVAFDIDPAATSSFVKEPPQFVAHRWTKDAGFVSHTVFVEDFDGPYPFLDF